MPSYRALLDDASKTLYQQSETPRIDAELLLQHVIQQPLAWLISHGEKEATNTHIKEFFALVAKRFEGQPIAYLLGYRDFWTLRLKVNQHVLVPRPDTECLVEQALELLKDFKQSNILDLGTGSGAIALALAKERPHSRVFAIDQSNKALAIAKQNAISNKIENVEFLQSNWFEKIPCNHKFELIAANPPYVKKNDEHLDALRFEPNLALVSDQQGLGDIQRIIKAAPEYLNKNGYLILEHGFEQQEAVIQLLKENHFKNIQAFKDLNQLPRCSAAQWLN